MSQRTLANELSTKKVAKKLPTLRQFTIRALENPPQRNLLLSMAQWKEVVELLLKQDGHAFETRQEHESQSRVTVDRIRFLADDTELASVTHKVERPNPMDEGWSFTVQYPETTILLTNGNWAGMCGPFTFGAGDISDALASRVEAACRDVFGEDQASSSTSSSAPSATDRKDRD